MLVTYDEFGNYGHPDHIQAHRVATYAADLAAARSYRPDLGAAWEIAKVYWTTMSATWMRRGIRALREAGDSTSFEGWDEENLPRFMTDDEYIDAVVDGTDHVDAKMAAMRAHATQITVDGPFFALSNNLGNAVWGMEHYRLVRGAKGPVNDQGFEDDLFAGIEATQSLSPVVEPSFWLSAGGVAGRHRLP